MSQCHCDSVTITVMVQFILGVFVIPFFLMPSSGQRLFQQFSVRSLVSFNHVNSVLWTLNPRCMVVFGHNLSADRLQPSSCVSSYDCYHWLQNKAMTLVSWLHVSVLLSHNVSLGITNYTLRVWINIYIYMCVCVYKMGAYMHCNISVCRRACIQNICALFEYLYISAVCL